MNISRLYAVFFVAFVAATGATALRAAGTEDPWYYSASAQGVFGDYSGSEQRQGIQSYAAFLKADYLEQGGLTAGYTRTLVSFKSNAQDDIAQNEFYLSGHYSLNPDALPGRLSLRLDGHYINNDDETGATDDVSIVGPMVSFLNYAKTFYLDLGYSRSSYGDSSVTSKSLDVDQWTPTLGFAFNNSFDWLQARVYYIDPSNDERALGKQDTTALELKWTHWFSPDAPLGIDDVMLGGLVGKRIFAVDPDTATVYNVVDVQKGGLNLTGGWELGENTRLAAGAGWESYENPPLDDDYDSFFLYLNLAREW